jgi:hypothetical protein
MTARPLTGERHLICIQFPKAGKNATIAKLKKSSLSGEMLERSDGW